MDMTLAILLGLFFGIALNLTGATNPEKIIRMQNLTDMHLTKTILLAIGTASAGLFIALIFGLIDPAHISIKTAHMGVIIGGALLGAGFAISGYCPGTGLAAMSTGRKDAAVFVLGGVLEKQTGVPSMDTSNIDQAKKLAELEELARSNRIKERLEAIKNS